MKRIYVCLPVFCLFLLCLPWASAQSAFDVNIGLGSFNDAAASGSGLDSPASLNAFGTCTPGSADQFCQATGSLDGFFLGLGLDIMFTNHFGAGFQANFQPERNNYGPLQDRETFYDVNGIYAPINHKRVVVQLLGGIGGARTSFSFNESGCIGTAVCSSQNEPVGTANHFDVHVGVGVQFFLTSHIFIRPQFDYHYVPGLTNQFNSDSVVGGSVWLGYNFGER